MAIMDFFKPSAPAPAPAPTNTPPASTAISNAGPATPGAGVVPAPDGKMPGTGQGVSNPLDSYTKLFQTSPNNDAPPSFNLDPKVLSEVSGSLNFTQGLSPELLSKATNGDAAALMEVINLVGQQSYKAAIHHSTSLTDKFVGARSQFDLQNVDSKVKSHLTKQNLQATPNYDHPVVKQQLTLVADAMQAANPDATPQEIAQAAAKYIQDLAAAITPAPAKTPAELANTERDWASYLTQS